MAELNTSTTSRFEGIGFEITKVVYIFSMVSVIASCLMGTYSKDARYVPLCMGLLLIPVYSVVVRRLIKNFFLFFLAHVILAGLLFLYKDPVIMALIGGYVLADIIYIYVRKISGVNDPMTGATLVVAFAVAIITYIFTGRAKLEFVHPVIITVFIMQIVAYLVYFHQMNIRETLVANTQSASQSIKKINRLNSKVIWMFVVILLILIGVGIAVRLDVAFTMIGRGLLIGLRFIVRLVFQGGKQDTETGPIYVDEAGGQGDPNTVPDDYVTWPIWLILEKILYVFAVIVMLALIGYIFYRLYQKFKMDRVEEDVLSDYAETTVFVERVKREKKERRSLWDILNVPNDKKVRRLYQKKILHRIKAGDRITAADTPRQILETVKAEDLTHITEVYERARYSDIPITKEDVQSIS
ncbi:MAG: DUF4129 domain-containing protein [Clostridiales bacterium]|nr:DUF4129 domain-containing protein [Clostridiales bacterium]